MEIIAELGASHEQDYQTALDLVFAAQEAGADTIKVQAFTPEQMTLDRDDWVIKDGLWKGRKFFELYQEAAMPIEWVGKLKKLSEQLNMGFIASVYHPDMVKTTEEIDVPRYKIASFELPWLDLIDTVAKTGKPIVMSVGMAKYKEIEAAVKAVKRHHDKITLLWCISEYPAKPEEMNLKTITALSHCFKVKSGFSDHSKGFLAPVIATAFDSVILEKHIQIDGGLDKGFALYPEEFKAMVKIVRETEKAIGQITYGGKKQFRRKKVEGKWVRTC